MENQGRCEECCGKNFSLNFLNMHEISNLQIYQGPQCTIIIVYEKNKKIHMAISYDCGETFSEHVQIMEIEGKIKKIVILADNSQFVVALLETIEIDQGKPGIVKKRAVSGKFPSDDKSIKFSYKKCENYESKPDEEIIDMSCGWRPLKNGQPGEIESVDYVFVRLPNNKVLILCFGHGCIIKE